MQEKVREEETLGLAGDGGSQGPAEDRWVSNLVGNRGMLIKGVFSSM